MVATLFYTDELPDAGSLAVLGGDEGFHAATVRRIRPGNAWCSATAPAGWPAARWSTRARRAAGAVLERWTVAPPNPPVTVVQALPKSERSELAVELATEAGADGFLAWQAARCVANWHGPRVDKGLRRWRAVAKAAARQSRRPHIPTVDGVLSTASLTSRIRDEVAAGAVVLALHESATDRLTDVPVAQAKSLFLVIGPEGGIADDELAALRQAGALSVRLGPQVLRTSTAAAVALGALGVLTPRWDDAASP